jgi:hypothetical protein
MTARGLPRRTLLLLPLALAACGGGGPETQNFPPLHYDYLPTLKLKVASIAIENEWQSSGDADHVESLSPETPLAALRRMANDRLAAYGTSGKAVFVIEDASLVRTGSEINGSFAVRLDVYSGDGTKSGFAEARVSRSAPAPSGEGPALSQTLYNLTRQMMDSMNVEFEYQLRRTLGDWLVQGSAAPAPIQAEPLGAPGTSSAAPAAPAAPPGAVTPQPTPAPAPTGGILGTLPVAPSQPGTKP